VATPGEGLATPLGTSSVPPGMETPDTIELRKKKLDTDNEGYVCLLSLLPSTIQYFRRPVSLVV
jgi:hypothetical protein